MSATPGLDTSMLTFSSRLATFNTEHQVSKRRASSQKKKPSTVTWPHESPSAEELARAGFFYKPAPDSDDNVQCFHCAVKLDGWESQDVPLQEHLAHSALCAWAISLSVATESEERDPMSPDLVEARRSTFADLWPHEQKKGWKCKTNKMVDAGWTYDPSPQDQDGATCFYCNMSLDGWEPKDNPIDEHRRRAPDCLFFVLVERYKPARKGGRGRASTASKASRLSTQSMQSTFSEAPSLMSLGDAAHRSDDVEESLHIDTTISSDIGKGPKKSTKGRKKNTRQPSVEPSVTYPTLQDSAEDTELVQDKSKPKRGRKPKNAQDSTIIDDSAITEPTIKKTKGRSKAKQPSPPARISQDESQLQSELQEAAEFASTLHSPPPEPGRGVKRTSDGLEKNSIIDDVTADDSPPRPKRAAKGPKGKKTRKTPKKTQEESDVMTEDPTDGDVKPNRGRSRKPRKVEPEPEPETYQEPEHETIQEPDSELAQEIEPDSYQEPEPESIQEPEPGEEPEIESQPEVAEGIESDVGPDQHAQEDLDQELENEPEVEEQLQENVGQDPETEPEQEEDEVEPAAETEAEEDVDVEAEDVDDEAESVGDEAEDDAEMEAEEEHAESPSAHDDAEMQEEEAEVEAEVDQPEEPASLAPTPAPEEFEPTPTPRAARLSVACQQTPDLAPESVHSTPQSQQSSDAENHPPPSSSSNHAPPTTAKKALTSAPTSDAENHALNPALNPREFFTSPSKTMRIPLATSTPNRSPTRRSPSKFGQLTSSIPWESVDPEAVFFPPSENGNTDSEDVFSKLLETGGTLTAAEKKMTVEEWIRWRAELGEAKLKSECERMVMLFEKEGNRALQALSGIQTL